LLATCFKLFDAGLIFLATSLLRYIFLGIGILSTGYGHSFHEGVKLRDTTLSFATCFKPFDAGLIFATGLFRNIFLGLGILSTGYGYYGTGFRWAVAARLFARVTAYV
jgi:hypothetical protein